MKAVVMAGGEGTRLRPLTCNRPKPMVTLVNKPIMEHIIELLKSHGITDIVVTLYYLADEVMDYFGDGRDFGVNINYSIEDTPLGTAGSVKKTEELLLDGTFLIISGDALTDINLSEIIEFHKNKKAIATITLTRVDNPLEFGVVITDEDGRIRRFLEKPSWGEVFSDTINTGIYVLEPEIFSFMEKDKSYDFSQDLFPLFLEKDLPLYGYIASGYWGDVGNLALYRRANNDILTGKVKVNIPGKQIKKGVWLEEGAEVSSEAQIEGPVVIGKNVKIRGRAIVDEFTVIGDNCVIEDEAILHRSIIWNNSYIGNNAKLNGGIVCRGCIINSAVNIMEGAVIGDKSYLGENSVIHPHIKLWPEKKIDIGAKVNMSLIWGKGWSGSLFDARGISGLANIDITPDFVIKVASAFGSSFPKHSIVMTSRDTHSASRMINRSIISGLLSTGINVLDMRVMPTPVGKYALRIRGAKGGVHTRIHPQDNRKILIEFFDSRGINIDKSGERKVENLFVREDIRRSSLEDIGTLDFPSRILEQYVEGFATSLDVNKIRGANLKVVIDYSYGNTSLVLPMILGKLGCETIALNAYLDSVKSIRSMQEKEKALEQLSGIVTTLKANLGIAFEIGGEQIILIDDQGEIISGNQLLALLTYLVCLNYPGSSIVVPVTAPSIVDHIASKFKSEVIRTKADGRSIMNTAARFSSQVVFAGDTDGYFIFPGFQVVFDGMFAFGKILEMITAKQIVLSKLAREIPPFYWKKEEVVCDWKDKGKIMRILLEETKELNTELIEGIKVYFDTNEWVLIIPDTFKPLFHIYAEGRNQQRVKEILSEYTKKIARFTS